MNSEKCMEYFIEGIAIIISLYEICRTGKKSRRKIYKIRWKRKIYKLGKEVRGYDREHIMKSFWMVQLVIDNPSCIYYYIKCRRDYSDENRKK